MNPELASAIIASAKRLGVNPLDIATSISYETGGRMSPSIRGGADNKMLGLIQFDPENQKKYGVTPDQTAPEQMQAVESYLRDRGVKPGMGLKDIYSTINAGAPGLYNRSDAANGGAPGTVADKVDTQMGPHMANAASLLSSAPVGALAPMDPTSPIDPTQMTGAPAPLSLAPPGVGALAAPANPMAAALSKLGGALNPQGQQGQQAPQQPAQPTYLHPQQIAAAQPGGGSQAIAAALAKAYGIQGFS